MVKYLFGQIYSKIIYFSVTFLFLDGGNVSETFFESKVEVRNLELSTLWEEMLFVHQKS